MSIVIEPASKSDKDVIVKSLWGSVERMVNSPGFKDCEERITYLKRLLVMVDHQIELERAGIEWWNLWKKITFPIYTKLLIKAVVKPAEELIKSYEHTSKLIIGFMMTSNNETFSFFIECNKEFITTLNKYNNITDDKYLK